MDDDTTPAQHNELDADGRPAKPPAAKRRRIVLSVGALALLVLGAVLLMTGVGRQEPAPPGRVDTGQAGSSTSPSAPSAPEATDDEGHEGHKDGKDPGGDPNRVTPLAASAPVQVSIPKLDVSSSLENLELDGRKVMETPRDPAKAGWFSPGPTPGAQGPSVIAGHVTWDGKPSVFFKLATLKAGDDISVKREDGSTAEFTVDKVAQYPKDRFPTVDVYRNLDHAGLRLITCGGTYSKADRYYADNIVVYASLSGSSRT